MHQRDAEELAQLRQALRDLLMMQDPWRATGPLARLRQVALAEGDRDLRAEYERWSFRFEMLTA